MSRGGGRMEAVSKKRERGEELTENNKRSLLGKIERVAY